MFDCEYSTVWESSNFLATLILLEITFGLFQKVKNCRCNNFRGFEFGFFGKNSHLKMSKVAKNLKCKAAQVVKMAVF